MSEFQPPHQPGDTAEQCHHPDIPEREDPRPDLSREVGAIACGPACPYYRGELDNRENNTTPTETERTEEMASDTVTIAPDRVRQISREIREARTLVSKLEAYVIPGMRNRDPSVNKNNATMITILPIVPIVHDPDSPFKGGYRPFTRVASDG